MTDLQAIINYINSHPIKGRFNRKNIRDYLRVKYPDCKDFVFKIGLCEEKEEITFEDFKNFIDEKD